MRMAIEERGAVTRLVRDGVLGAIARRFARAGLDPEDLVQDMAEKLLRRPMPADARERPWLARTMRNLAIDRIRRRRSRREELTDEELAIGAQEAAWWELLTEDDVRAQAASLPGEQRAVFELFAFEGCSYTEIAARLGIPKATVGTRILRARQKLRQLLAEARGEPALTPGPGAAPRSPRPRRC